MPKICIVTANGMYCNSSPTRKMVDGTLVDVPANAKRKAAVKAVSDALSQHTTKADQATIVRVVDLMLTAKVGADGNFTILRPK